MGELAGGSSDCSSGTSSIGQRVMSSCISCFLFGSPPSGFTSLPFSLRLFSFSLYYWYYYYYYCFILSIKLFLSQPTSFLASALLILSPIPLGWREWASSCVMLSCWLGLNHDKIPHGLLCWAVFEEVLCVQTMHCIFWMDVWKYFNFYGSMDEWRL